MREMKTKTKKNDHINIDAYKEKAYFPFKWPFSLFILALHLKNKKLKKKT